MLEHFATRAIARYVYNALRYIFVSHYVTKLDKASKNSITQIYEIT